MAVFKCKLCGGALDIGPTQSVAVCEYCGTKQTLPRLDDERKANLYDKASQFRRNNDFDKAVAIYEQILNEDSTDAESYWSVLLCRYGIEYVEDSKTHKRIPTINRAQFASVFDDEYYKSALKYADASQREIYEAEAAAINEIQKEILAISQKEAPFDIFICYKETDANGRRLPDSVLAQELYYGLKNEGFKVFFSRITLEDKIGSAFEPYIFAALNSAKVMVVVGTKPEHLNSVWVKNEWSRYLALIRNGAEKTLIPAFRDMEPSNLPEEFSHLQAQDMSKLSFLQDLVRDIKKIISANENTAPPTAPTVTRTAELPPLFRRILMALNDNEFENADCFAEQILNQEPENAEAYLYKLLAELHLQDRTQLGELEVLFGENRNYRRAMQFGSRELQIELAGYLNTVYKRLEDRRKNKIYISALAMMEGAKTLSTLQEALASLQSIADHKDTQEKIQQCEQKIAHEEERLATLKLERQRKAEERRRIAKIRLKKIKKISIVSSIVILIIAAICGIAYYPIFHVAIPNGQYEDALDYIKNQDYDQALPLLEKAKEKASSSKAEKIEQAILVANTAKEMAAATKNEDYRQKINTLLFSGLSVEVVYNTDGGRVKTDETIFETNRFTYQAGDQIEKLYSSSKSSYVFIRWTYTGLDYREADGAVTVTFSAVYTKQEFTIQYFYLYGKNENPTLYTVEDESFTLKAPTRRGYTFIGWTGTGLDSETLEVTIPKGSNGHRSYNANWQANEYQLSFDPNGGTLDVSEMTVTYGKIYSYPIPEREGYTFAGWYLGDKRIEDGIWIYIEGGVLRAQWT